MGKIFEWDNALDELDKISNREEYIIENGKEFLYEFTKNLTNEVKKWIDTVNKFEMKVQMSDNIRTIRRDDCFSILGTKFNVNFVGHPTIKHFDVRYSIGNGINSNHQIYLFKMSLDNQINSTEKRKDKDSKDDYIYKQLHKELELQKITPEELAKQMSREIYEHYVDYAQKTIKLNEK